MRTKFAVATQHTGRWHVFNTRDTLTPDEEAIMLVSYDHFKTLEDDPALHLAVVEFTPVIFADDIEDMEARLMHAARQAKIHDLTDTELTMDDIIAIIVSAVIG